MARGSVLSLALAAIMLAAISSLAWWGYKSFIVRHISLSSSALVKIPTQDLPGGKATEKLRTKVAKLARSNGAADLPPSPEALEAVLPSSVVKWVAAWESHELEGRGASDDEMHALHELLLSEAVDPVVLCGLMRTIDLVDGHVSTDHIYRVVIDKTTATLNGVNPPNSDAAPLIAAMWPLHDILSDMHAHDADRTLVESLRKWETRGSPHSLMVDTLYAELLYQSGDNDAATSLLTDLEQERKATTNTSEGVNRPLDWDIALSLSHAGHYAEAAKRFEAAAQQHAAFSRAAALSVPVMLYRAGQHPEAIAKFKEASATYHLSAKEIDDLAHQMQGG